MKIKEALFQRLFDENRNKDERLFEMLTIISIVVAVVALAGDILVGENIIEILLLVITIVVVPMITALSIRYGKVDLGVKVIVLGLVFIINPILYYCGGGMHGGGAFWIVFSFLYIGLIMHGMWRNVMLLCLGITVIMEYGLSYVHPEWVYPHTEDVAHIDASISAILVGVVSFVMVWFQNRMFIAENKRAKAQTAKAEDAIRSQNQFFSSMSHEIRTPINSILGLNEIILRQEDASEEVRKDASNIQGAGRMLLALVNDILDISKIEAGKMEIVPVNYDVGALISEIVNMIWLGATQKGLKLTVDIDPQVPSELFGDEVRIKQILVNLLNNAIKYTKEGTVGLHIESESLGEENVLLTISVSDTGQGIKQDALPHLFSAFQRVDEEKNRFIEGTGLGLSIVKQLVELMNGKITVNSIYTQGSTFKVTLPQAVTNREGVGDINITNPGMLKGRTSYVSRIRVADAAVLIVDDNEMNLEVERKLLLDTGIMVDTVISGEHALEATLLRAYDIILMDHLMPEMDGIECLTHIRRQPGGLNRTTPVIVLTANAGSENRRIYNLNGFDDYLLKPVSGRQLEDVLIAHLPEEKVEITSAESAARTELRTSLGYSKKVPILITSSSVCDLPGNVTRELELDLMPFLVHTDNGTFWDNVEAVSDELLKYMMDPKHFVKSEPPTKKALVDFFAREIQKAHHVIYLTFTAEMSEEYERAIAAARAFDNVTVINSGNISAGIGLLVLSAYRLVQQGQSVENIVVELERIKRRIRSSFMVSQTEFLYRRGFISDRLYRVLDTLNLRPSLIIKKSTFGVDHIWMGQIRKCLARYIKHALPRSANPDLDILFVVHAGIAVEDLEWVEEVIRKRFEFKNIVFEQASAALSINCGPGTLGLFYMEKGNTDYQLGELLPEDAPFFSEDAAITHGSTKVSFRSPKEIFHETDGLVKSPTKDVIWYHNIADIDGEVGIKNSGGEEAFRSVLEIFYDSIEDKSDELENLYEKEDWKSYTIKVHALKSSSRLVGAVELGADAEKLEAAGKEGDLSYIRANHERAMQIYTSYRRKLAPFFTDENDGKESEEERPMADSSMVRAFYESILEAAKEMDMDVMEEAFGEMEAYAFPDEEKKRFEQIKKCYDSFDYNGILDILDNVG